MRPRNVPVAEISFAAKAGFLSKPIWNEFFAKGLDRWQRKQWQLLLDRGVFIRYPSRLPRDVLVLNRKSPLVLAIVGEAISMHPFVSQIEHDEYVAKIVLELGRNPKVLGYRLEAEMKREDWMASQLRQTAEKTKFPDGILEVSGPTDTIRIAIEVETSCKDKKRYRQILKSYAARRDLSRVLFLARSQYIFDSLKTAMQETYYPDSERPIGFCDLDAWLRNPLNACIYFSNGETTMERLIG